MWQPDLFIKPCWGGSSFTLDRICDASHIFSKPISQISDVPSSMILIGPRSLFSPPPSPQRAQFTRAVSGPPHHQNFYRLVAASFPSMFPPPVSSRIRGFLRILSLPLLIMTKHQTLRAGRRSQIMNFFSANANGQSEAPLPCFLFNFSSRWNGY